MPTRRNAIMASIMREYGGATRISHWRTFEPSTGATMCSPWTDTHATPTVISAAIDRSPFQTLDRNRERRTRRHRCTDKPVVRWAIIIIII